MIRVHTARATLLCLALVAGCAGQVGPGTDGNGSGSGNGDGSGGNGGLGGTSSGPSTPPVPATDHPRLYIRSADLPALRARAVDGNPLWSNGLAPLLAAQAKNADAARALEENPPSGGIPSGTGAPFLSTGCGSYGLDGCEAYAELFAFGALVHPDAATAAHYKDLAHWLVMKLVNEYLGNMMGNEQTDFTTDDRSRWNGESLALAVDWIYDSFSAGEKATIDQAFTQLCDILIAQGYHHLDPALYNNDAALIADRASVRWAGNNYWTAHMRNIGLMSMAVDAADDPGGKLATDFLHAVKAYLFVFDDLTRHECAGGVCAEGPEYAPQTLSYAAELMLALRTAGRNDPAIYGPQVWRAGNPFWGDLVEAWAASQSPATVTLSNGEGPQRQPAWNGDGGEFVTPNGVPLLGAIAVDARLGGDATLADAAEWLSVGGAAPADIAARVRGSGRLADSVLLFLAVDPSAVPADPHPSIPTRLFAPGMGMILARTDWSANASFFSWHVGWQTIDHQHCDANDFALYRKGEWLTKETTGYQTTNTDVLRSDGHNTVAVLNNGPTDHTDWRLALQQNGSQMNLVADGDPSVVAHALADGYVYAEGDATPLYNSKYESSGSVSIEDVKHVSRAIVWLPPDRVLVYDRAETGTDGRFKRVWFHFPSTPTATDAQHVVATTAGKQQVALSVLLPAGATITPSAWKPTDEASFDPMAARAVTEADTASARFLHLVEGLDAGATPTAATPIAAVSGPPVDGAVVAGTAVVFARDLGSLTSAFSFNVAGAQHVLVTGLTAGAGYTTSRSGDVVTVTPGGSQTASDGALYF